MGLGVERGWRRSGDGGGAGNGSGLEELGALKSAHGEDGGSQPSTRPGSQRVAGLGAHNPVCGRAGG